MSPEQNGGTRIRILWFCLVGRKWRPGGHLCFGQWFLTKVRWVVVGRAVESELSQVGDQTGDPPSVDTLTLTQHIQLQHSPHISRHQPWTLLRQYDSESNMTQVTYKHAAGADADMSTVLK